MLIYGAIKLLQWYQPMILLKLCTQDLDVSVNHHSEMIQIILINVLNQMNATKMLVH